MAEILESAGATVIYCPTIETAGPDSWSGLDDSIRRITTYDWIVFASANAVKFFSQRLRELGLSIAIIEPITSCAIGPATAAALELAGGIVDVTAADSRAEGALEAIISRAGSTQAIRGLRFLIPRAQVAREFLPEELRKMGAVVETPDTYKTVKPDLDGQTVTRLLDEHRISAITFTSPSTVEHFVDLIGRPNLAELLRGVLIACIGPVTAAAIRQHGFNQIIQPEKHNGKALARAIIDALGRDTDPPALSSDNQA